MTLLKIFFFHNSFSFFIFNFCVKFNLQILGEINNSFFFLSVFSFGVYIIALGGLLLNLKNILISIFFVELAYFGIIVFFMFTSLIFQTFHGFLLALLLILLAASESAVGLGIVIIIYTFEKKIVFDDLVELV